MHLHKKGFILYASLVLLPLFSMGQQLKITDFVILGGNANCPNGVGQKVPLYPGCAVTIGASSQIKSGTVGSYNLVKSAANVFFGNNIYSGGIVQLGNNNSVIGKISASNLSKVSGNTVDIALTASVTGNIDAAGNITVGNGITTVTLCSISAGRIDTILSGQCW